MIGEKGIPGKGKIIGIGEIKIFFNIKFYFLKNLFCFYISKISYII